ncbi:MAG: DsbE family thiol:disulfide interchange protein [Immundisolibacteraceae bacterium]|nr:DsbE family thiol:disulfide interchange protein [Immundisolibacteraceae bacterium]
MTEPGPGDNQSDMVPNSGGGRGRRGVLMLIPLIVIMMAILFVGLTRNPGEIPSPLIGKTLPAISGVDLDGNTRQLPNIGKPMLLNIWASWCSACVAEHQVIVAAAKRYAGQVDFVGLNYRDKQPDAKRWLSRLGNPYAWSLQDLDGRAGIELGVYGAPETYFIDAEGVIVGKKIGPLNVEYLRDKLVEYFGINS